MFKKLLSWLNSDEEVKKDNHDNNHDFVIEDIHDKVATMTIGHTLNGEPLLYIETALTVMSRVSPFTDYEKDNIIETLVKFEEGKGVHIETIYNLFKTKQWYWEELEFWRMRMRKNSIPYTLFLRLNSTNAYDIEKGIDVFEVLTLPKAKKVLMDNNYDIPKKILGSVTTNGWFLTRNSV